MWGNYWSNRFYRYFILQQVSSAVKYRTSKVLFLALSQYTSWISLFGLLGFSLDTNSLKKSFSNSKVVKCNETWYYFWVLTMWPPLTAYNLWGFKWKILLLLLTKESTKSFSSKREGRLLTASDVVTELLDGRKFETSEERIKYPRFYKKTV